MMLNRLRGFLYLIAILLSTTGLAPVAQADAMSSANTAVQSPESIMQEFAGDTEVSDARKIETERKHQILFLMGISLLVLLFLTGTMGIAMVAFDKDVFVPHMILAGLSLTLASVHAATSIAWFWPY